METSKPEISHSSGIKTMTKCPACNSDRIEAYIQTDLTTFLFPVSEEVIGQINKVPIALSICKTCSHIFQTRVNKDLLNFIYKDLYGHYNLDTSEEFQDVYRAQTLLFLEQNLPSGKNQTMLDIGCGEGTYFPFFNQRNYTCYGIEPSQKSEIAKEKNPTSHISNAFFDGSMPIGFNVKFDVIMMNWVLEHIEDVDIFFDGLVSHLKRGTVLFLQVPDMDYYITNQIPLFYVHEHINYFDLHTLCVLLKRKGFALLGENHNTTPALLVAAVYKGNGGKENSSCETLVTKKKNYLSASNALKDEINRFFCSQKTVIFYGMGYLAFWISDFCLDDTTKSKIILLDDNAYYRNKYVPSFKKKLEEYPDGHDLSECTILITTSPVYHETIKRKIREKYTGNFKIDVIHGRTIVPY